MEALSIRFVAHSHCYSNLKKTYNFVLLRMYQYAMRKYTLYLITVLLLLQVHLICLKNYFDISMRYSLFNIADAYLGGLCNAETLSGCLDVNAVCKYSICQCNAEYSDINGTCKAGKPSLDGTKKGRYRSFY